jgi:Tfp pilus assembly protein PilF
MKTTDQKNLLTVLVCLSAMLVMFGGCPTPKAVIVPAAKVEEPVDAGVESIDAGVDAGKADEQLSGKIEDEDDKQVVPEAAKAAFNRGITLLYSNPAGAIASFREALQIDPALPKAHNNLGLIFEWQGNYSDAEAEYRQALAIKADYYPAMCNIAALMMRQGNISGAEAFIKERSGKYKQSLSLKNKLAEIELAAGRVEDAMKRSMDVLKFDEKNTTAMLNLAQAYFLQKKYELSQMVLDNAREIDKNLAGIYVLSAHIRQALGDRQQAIELFKQALALRDDLPDVHNNLGYLYNEAGDFTSATAEFQRALFYNPEYVKARLNLANALRGNRQYEEAEAEYKKVLASGKGGSEVLYNLGILYLDMEREFKDRDTIVRLKLAVEFLEKYKASASLDAKDATRVADCLKEAEKKLKQKEMDLERDKKRKLKEADEKKRKEEATAKKAAEEETKRKAAEEEATKKAAADAAVKKAADEEAAKKAADAEAARQAAEADKSAKAADAAKKAADEEAARQAAVPAPIPETSQVPASQGGKVSDEEEPNKLPTAEPSGTKVEQSKSVPPVQQPPVQPPAQGGKLDVDE